jgi:hypothetical protein
MINKEKLKTKFWSSTDFETDRNQERRTLRADKMRGDEYADAAKRDWYFGVCVGDRGGKRWIAIKQGDGRKLVSIIGVGDGGWEWNRIWGTLSHRSS